MTAQMNHTNHRTSTVERPTTTRSGGSIGTTPEQSSGRGGGRRPYVVAAIVAAGALAAWTGALVIDANSEPSSEPAADFTTSQRLVEESIDQALADRAPVEYTTSQRLVQESIDQALAGRGQVQSPSTGSPPQIPASEFVQPGTDLPQGYDVEYWQSVEDHWASTQVTAEIPTHLQDVEARFNTAEYTTSQRLIQESIDSALAESNTSFDVAEANRMATLKDLATTSGSNTSFDVAEANRMATLKDLASTSGSNDSFDVAEANRMATLKDLASTSSSNTSFDVAEANRMATLRDLS